LTLDFPLFEVCGSDPLDNRKSVEVKSRNKSNFGLLVMAQSIFAWQQPYLDAVQETNDSKLPHHLLEAIAAVEQRLLSPIDKDSLEYKAIESTRRGIEILRAERCPSWNRQVSPAIESADSRADGDTARYRE
jgi:hypothetical protein